MTGKCMCNCFECNLQEDHESKIACAAFMAVRIASDNKRQIDLLINKLSGSPKKEKKISSPIFNEDIGDDIDLTGNDSSTL